MDNYNLEQINRGSEWHRWDPHIHAPGTVLSDQYPKADGWEQYLNALETASPPLKAIGVTDYCVTRSYERLRTKKNSGRLAGCDLLFPNVELRLNTGTVKGNFVNVHLLVSPHDEDHIQELNRFLSNLSFSAFGDKFACTPSDLVRLGKHSDSSLTDNEAVLKEGVAQFKVSLDNLIDAYSSIKWAQHNIVIAVAGTADGSSGVKARADKTLRQEIEKAAHVIFASSIKQREFWLGNGVASIRDLRERYNGPKACIWGSDAHDLDRVGKPVEGRFSWIKGNPTTFDALRQACIDPERAYVGPSPPSWAAPSQVIDEVQVENAPWLATPVVKLNPGLVGVIGARGSGKTALVDIIATGCDSYLESKEHPSFLARAREHLVDATVSLKWQNGDDERSHPLVMPVNIRSDAYPRVRYLSQQFVEELCSNKGMPNLIKEIERVIFEAHPTLERDGAVDFDELLEFRASRFRATRIEEEKALAKLSDQIGVELEKAKQVQSLKKQIEEKEKSIRRYTTDRKGLLPKKNDKISERLQELLAAAEKVRGYLRYYANQDASIERMKSEVQNLRQNRAPEALRSMKEHFKNIKIESDEWNRFLLEYSGDVDAIVTKKITEVKTNAKQWKGETPTIVDNKSNSFLSTDVALEKQPLAILEAEIERLENLVTADKETARKLDAISKRIANETTMLERLKEKLADCEGAGERAKELVADRQEGYKRVFEAVIGEERVLTKLYAPLMKRRRTEGGTLSKLTFTVTRIADVERWAKRGENDLFDLRGGPFKGIGSLAREANEILADAWVNGDADEVRTAMSAFLNKHQSALLANAPYQRSADSNYRRWARRFASWLYSTDHISIEYGIQYDGIDLRKLSPGTRGIVLVLLYLALDDADDRPLIIDQPEENLDPRSIYDELVPLFKAAKRKRQVILVTHNANLVVNADSDQVIVADVGAHTGAGLPPISYRSGGLEEEHIRRQICDTLEGGELAFIDRARRLRISLER